METEIFLVGLLSVIGFFSWMGAIILVAAQPVFNSAQRISWVAIVTFVPLLGPFFYFFVYGGRRVTGRSYRRV